MTIKEIVKKWLEDNGCDGLCGEDCGCGIDDIMPCVTNGCLVLCDCVAAKKVIATEEHYDPEYSEFDIGDEIYVKADIPDEPTEKKEPCADCVDRRKGPLSDRKCSECAPPAWQAFLHTTTKEPA